MAAVTQNITAEQGAALSVTLTGAGASLNGRTLRMHVRAKVGDTTTKLVASTTDGRLTVGANPYTTASLSIGADVMAAVSVTSATEYWVYDVESYTGATDVRREWQGRFTITRDVTRDTEADTEDALAGVVLYSGPQSLTTSQQDQAWDNIGGDEAARDVIGATLVAGSNVTLTVDDNANTITIAATGGGGGGSGDVVGPASATDDRIAAFDGTTGKLIKQGSVTATAVASHLSSTSNPHSVTAAQVGADPAGTASTAVSTHAGAVDPHGDRAYADGLAGNYATAAQGALADSAVQDVAAEIHAATAASLADDDEQGFWQSASSAMRKITWANVKATLKAYFDTLYAAVSHNQSATTITSGTLDAARLPAATETAQGAVELATTAEALTGTDTTRAVTAAGVKAVADTKAASSHTHAASDITSGTLDAARLPSATTSASGAVELATVAECQAGTDTTRATTPEGVAAAITALGLAQPLTTVRATRQTSAPSAAASGEVKFQFRDIARYPLLDAVSDVSDPLLLFPSLADPMVSGWWVLNSTTTAFKGLSAIANVAATVSASTLGSNIPALNMATNAAANAYSGSYVTSNTFREGSATGNGYLVWGITMTPDASYGSGATGVVINLGAMDQAGGTVNGNRPSARCAMLQYNTNQSDTNWQLLVHNGTTLTTVDTGCAFAAEGIWLWAIHVPRGGSATYAYVKNLVTGSSGSATASATSGSTALYFMPAWICTLTTTARNIRFVSAYLRAGGAS